MGFVDLMSGYVEGYSTGLRGFRLSYDVDFPPKHNLGISKSVKVKEGKNEELSHNLKHVTARIFLLQFIDYITIISSYCTIIFKILVARQWQQTAPGLSPTVHFDV